MPYTEKSIGLFLNGTLRRPTVVQAYSFPEEAFAVGTGGSALRSVLS